MAPHNHPQVCVCVCVCVYVRLSPTSNRSACLAPGLACSQKNTHMHMHTQTSPVDKKKKPLELNREAKEAYLPDNRRESWPHTNDSVCVRQGSHETATSVKVLFFIFILFLKPQYHPLTFHLNEHYPQQCLRAAGNISWPHKLATSCPDVPRAFRCLGSANTPSAGVASLSHRCSHAASALFS